MHYYIDGYNLLFRIKYRGEDLRKQREQVISELTSIIGMLEIDATIVFDAAYKTGESTRSHINNVEIVYTSEGESADEYIIQELRSTLKPRQETVVTSDNKLSWRARRKGAKTETIEEFSTWLHQRYRNKFRPKKKEIIPSKITQKEPQVKKAPPVQSITKPHKKASAEECFDYYQNTFQEAYEKIKKEEKPKISPKETSHSYKKDAKPKKIEKTKEEQALDDMERWLSIFEKKVRE